MREKIRRIRNLFRENKYDEEILEEAKDIPTYDLFTPERSTLVCEEEELANLKRVRFLKHKEGEENIALFLVFVDNLESKDITPIRMYLRYNIEDSSLPHYPGGDYRLNIHDSEKIRDISTLSKYEIDKDDIYNITKENLPAVKVRGVIKEMPVD